MKKSERKPKPSSWAIDDDLVEAAREVKRGKRGMTIGRYLNDCIRRDMKRNKVLKSSSAA